MSTAATAVIGAPWSQLGFQQYQTKESWNFWQSYQNFLRNQNYLTGTQWDVKFSADFVNDRYSAVVRCTVINSASTYGITGLEKRFFDLSQASGSTPNGVMEEIDNDLTPRLASVKQMIIDTMAADEKAIWDAKAKAAAEAAAIAAKGTNDALTAALKAEADRIAAINARDAATAVTMAADKVTLSKSCETKMQADNPAPIGCDWKATISPGPGYTYIDIALTSVLAESTTVIKVSGNMPDVAQSAFLEKVNQFGHIYYSDMISRIVGTPTSVGNKADADAAIFNALLDLDRYPPIPYDAILAGRADLMAVLAARKTQGRSIAQETIKASEGQGNYPPVTVPVPISNLPDPLPITTQPYESDLGYEDLTPETLAPGLPILEVEPPFLPKGIVYPVPATGSNFANIPGGGNILAAFKDGTLSLDVGLFVSLGLVPQDFGDYEDWTAVQNDYQRRQKASQTAVTALDDKKVLTPPVDTTTVSEPQSHWWIVGGILALIIGVAYMQKGE
jgi:hypothetical protein